MINSEKLSEIKLLLGDGFQNLLTVYTTDTLARYKDIELALSGNDLTKVRDLAHAMKSSSANIGADDVSSLAADIEQMAGLGQSSEISGILPMLQKAIDDTIQIMNN